MDESSPAQCSAIAQLQCQLNTQRCSFVTKSMYAGMRVVWLCQNENATLASMFLTRTPLLTPVMMTLIYHDGVPD